MGRIGKRKTEKGRIFGLDIRVSNGKGEGGRGLVVNQKDFDLNFAQN